MFVTRSPDPVPSLPFSLSLSLSLLALTCSLWAQNVKALVSIGGWTGSRYFSTSLGSAANRTVFVKTCMDLINQYQLDGLDFEYGPPALPTPFTRPHEIF